MMAFTACTNHDRCPRGYPQLRYHPSKCGGCAFAKAVEGGDNNPTYTDGTPLSDSDRSAVFKLRK